MGKSLEQRLKAKQQDIKDKSRGFAYFVIKEGTTRVRHLPAPEEEDWSIEATCFYLGKDIGLVISPHTFGEKCALMKAHTEFMNSKDKKEKEVATRIKPVKKFFSPVVKYKDENGRDLDKESGVKLLMMTPGLVNEAIDLYLDKREAGDFTDLKEGYDLKYGRTGKTKTDTEYSVRPCKPTSIKWSELSGKTFSPEEMLKAITPSYKETKRKLEKFLNLPPEEDDNSSNKGGRDKKKRRRDL